MITCLRSLFIIKKAQPEYFQRCLSIQIKNFISSCNYRSNIS
ncbi:hypothetical protein D920_01920 [Enterococcus faecalis 13-SD-W-01]|nr:hypothetical protein D920_01920 [Enterococcus faecalis 13-SD-W-01]